MPNLGLNMDWGTTLPFGRVEGNLKPMSVNRGPDKHLSEWVNRGPLDHPEPQSEPESNRKFSTAIQNDFHRLPARANSSKFYPIFSEPINIHNRLPVDESDNPNWPNRKIGSVNRVVFESDETAAIGPSSGTPFLPGLMAPEDFPAIRPLPRPSTIRPLPKPSRDYDNKNDKFERGDIRGILRGSPQFTPSKNNWDWSPSDSPIAHLGISDYHTSSFRPMNPHAPRNPIRTVNSPNDISKASVSDRTFQHPFKGLSNRVSTTTSDTLSVEDLYRNKIKTEIKKQSPGLFNPPNSKGVGSVINVNLREDTKNPAIDGVLKRCWVCVKC